MSAGLSEALAPLAERLASAPPVGGPDWLSDLRRRGLALFRAQGLPTRKVEAWKYTDLGPLARLDIAHPAPEVSLDHLPAAVPRLDAPTAVLVNGRFRPELSRLDGMPAGVVVRSLAALLAGQPALIEPLLGRLAPLDGFPFAALNTAMLADGIAVLVADSAAVETPLHVVSVSAAETPSMSHPRLLVALGRDARLTLVESHVGLSAGPYLANAVVEAYLAEGAQLHHARLQDEAPAAVHVALSQILMAGRAAYRGTSLQVGGHLARHDLRVLIGGAAAECRIDGAYMAAGEAHLDTVAFVDHAEGGSRSRQAWKAVVDDAARAVFQGKVLVRRDAQKTDGHQLTRGILLSPRAEIDAKPELEIYADDVKCGHGAAIGELDEAALFYLESRGIARAAARRLLVEGFLGEVVEDVPSPAVREAFRAVVRGWLDRREGGR